MRAAWILLGLVVLVLPWLPVPEWVNAPERGVPLGPHMEAWVIGLLVVVTLGALGGRIGARAAWSPRVALPASPAVPWVAALWTALAGVFVVLWVHGGRPQMVDELAQLVHASAFAAGTLALPAPVPAEAFLVTHTFVTDAGWISQFPPGLTALLALGLRGNMAWLVNPMSAFVATLALWCVAQGLYGRRTAVIAVALWVTSIWVVLMAGTHMSHMPAVAATLVGWAAIFGPQRVRWWHVVLAGVAGGLATVIRPLDGVAAAIPPALWVVRHRRWNAIPLAVLGAVPFLTAMLWVNAQLHGDPLTFGYTALWGSAHGLGFHVDPWGRPFTPGMALANLVSVVRGLHLRVFEWPIPALLPLGAWALAARHAHPSDRYLLAGMVAAPLLYFFHWHAGAYMGPRLHFAAAPMIVLGTARAALWLLRRVRHRNVPGFRATAAVWTMGCVTVLWGVVGIAPLRLEITRGEFRTMNLDPRGDLLDNGVPRALVLVPESFRARTIVGFWALGVDHSRVERSARAVESCDLAELLTSLRAQQATAETAAFALDSAIRAVRDTAPVITDWPDPWIRIRAGRELSAACRRELQRDLEGFTLYGAVSWQNPPDLRSGIVFARDLPELRDSLMSMYADRPIYRWAPPPATPDSLPVLTLMRPAP